VTRRKQSGPPAIVFVDATIEAPSGMRRVTVNTEGDRFISVDAWLCGEWTAHRRPGRRGWGVSYLPSGRDIGQLLTEVQARRLADWLDCHITRDEMLDWSSPSREVAARIYQGIEMVTTDVEALRVGEEMAS